MRTVRKLSQRLRRIARRKNDAGRAALKVAYGKLVAVAKRTRARGTQVVEALQDRAAPQLAERLARALPTLGRAIGQAERLVLKEDPVPSVEKLVSLFGPHAQVIPWPKAGKPVEFGRNLRLDEAEGEIIVGDAVVDRAGGQELPYLAEAQANHRRQFGRPPRLLAADRGMSSAGNLGLAKPVGLGHVALPYVGRATPRRREEETGRRSRGAYRPHARIEARLHAPERGRGLKRRRHRGGRGFGRRVGRGIVTQDLAKAAEVGSGR